MMRMKGKSQCIVDIAKLPVDFPTHAHTPEFWESLGRAVGTFGFLEEVLGKAIFSFMATREYAEHELRAAFEAWLPQLERALSDPLGGLINTYEKVVRDHGENNSENLHDLLEDLRKASIVRNVLCHGSWSAPDAQGRSVPLFMNRQNELFQSEVDVSFLKQTQRHVTELVCAVISTVTAMGWQFPGSSGPGEPILRSRAR
jgi:hypothetical protein